MQKSEHILLNLANIIRNTHPDMEKIYTSGGCYEFFRLCQSVVPEVECWGNDDHVYAKLGNSLFDINGIHDIPNDFSVYPMVNEPRILKQAPTWKDDFWRE